MKKLQKGMKLRLKKDLIVKGVYTINKGENGEIVSVEDNQIGIEIYNYGAGIFSTKEVDMYFEPRNILCEYSDVNKYIVNDNVVVVILNSGVKGIARCLEEDVFDEQTGIRIAYLKAKKKEIEKELKTY